MSTKDLKGFSHQIDSQNPKILTVLCSVLYQNEMDGWVLSLAVRAVDAPTDRIDWLVRLHL